MNLSFVHMASFCKASYRVAPNFRGKKLSCFLDFVPELIFRDKTFVKL